MKKAVRYMTMAVSLSMVFGLAGCGNKADVDAMTIDKLYEEGYAVDSCTLNGDTGEWQAYYIKDGDWTKPYFVELAMSPDEVEKVFDGSLSDEDLQELICSKETIEITDASDRVPAQEELDKYVGKSLTELEEEEYYNSGATDAEDGNVLVEVTKYGEYVLNLTLDQEMTFDEFEADNVDYSALTVKEVIFDGFSFEE